MSSATGWRRSIATSSNRSIAFYREDPTVREIPGAHTVFDTPHTSGHPGRPQHRIQSGHHRRDPRTTGLVGRHRRTISSDEVARGRPFPDMIRELMRRMGIEDPQRVVKVGDTPADLEEGRNAGCGMVVGVTRGTHSRAELESYPHTDLIDTVADLPAPPRARMRPARIRHRVHRVRRTRCGPFIRVDRDQSGVPHWIAAHPGLVGSSGNQTMRSRITEGSAVEGPWVYYAPLRLSKLP